MPLKTESVEEPHLNLTPMIDVVFLLIIFFMVGSEFTRRQAEAEVRYKIELPSVSGVQPLTDLPDPITVNIRSDGVIFVNGGPENAKNQEKSVVELEAFLKEAKRLDRIQKFDKRMVVIRGDGESRHKNFIAVVEILNRLEYKTISVAAKPESK